MSYYGNDNGSGSTLIARRGYAGLGDTFTGDLNSLPFCPGSPTSTASGVPGSVNAQGFCRDFPGGQAVFKGVAGGGGSGTLDKIGSFFGSLLGGAVSSFGKPAQPAVMLPPPSPLGGMMPILVIGGIGVAAVLLLRRPQSNPSRRRRRHNAARRRRLHRRRRR